VSSQYPIQKKKNIPSKDTKRDPPTIENPDLKKKKKSHIWNETDFA
jgi:hypothetical protein